MLRNMQLLVHERLGWYCNRRYTWTVFLDLNWWYLGSIPRCCFAPITSTPAIEATTSVATLTYTGVRKQTPGAYTQLFEYWLNRFARNHCERINRSKHTRSHSRPRFRAARHCSLRKVINLWGSTTTVPNLLLVYIEGSVQCVKSLKYEWLQ